VRRRTITAALLALIFMAGCVTLQPRRVETDAARRARLEATSRRAAAAADSATGLAPNRAAAVEKAMAAAGITLPEVAAYLATYGLEVVPGTTWKPWHWKASTGQVTYYVATYRVAVADTSTRALFRDVVSSPYCLWIEAVGPGGTSAPSLVGWSDGGNGSNAIPGVRVTPCMTR